MTGLNINDPQDTAQQKTCRKCGGTRFNNWNCCMDCRNARAKLRNRRIEENGGRHTDQEWRALVAEHSVCPDCGRRWEEIPLPTVAKWRSVITKGHIIPVTKGGTNDITNIKPQCYQCNIRQGTRLGMEVIHPQAKS